MTRLLKILPLRRRKGSIMAISLVLVAIASIGVLLMSKTLADQGRLNDRRRELTRAFFEAEAGIALVQHWGNFPEDFTDNPLMFERTPASESAQGFTNQFPHLMGAISSNGYMIDEFDLSAMDVGKFYSDHGYYVGKIKEIELLPPDNTGTIPAHDFRVRSLGESTDGIQRTVVAYFKANRLLNNSNLELPAALISLDQAGGGGNAKIHWGESWSQDDFGMFNKSQMGYVNQNSGSGYDSYAVYRTEGMIQFNNTWKDGYNFDLLDKLADQPGALTQDLDYENAFFQNIPAGTMEWPDFGTEYQEFKDKAIAEGRYYTTNSSGDILKNGVVVDFMDEFGEDDRDAAPYDLVFIDTIDGDPPAADGSNLADITISGTSGGLKGVYYVCANIKGTGVGNPPSLTVENPNTSADYLIPTSIVLDGVLYNAGTIDLGGGFGVYGSVVTEGGFEAGGTVDIYYNSALADGLPFENGNLGSTFTKVMQKNY